MDYFLLAGLWVLNFAISIWNSYSVGSVWSESKMAGGYLRFMCWMGAIMASVGFSWCYLIFAALTAEHFHYINPHQMGIVLQLGYLIIIPFLLFAGWAITIDSWVAAWKERNFISIGTAGWNTLATIHNSYEAYQNVGPMFSDVTSYFSSDDEDSPNGIVIVILLALGSIFAGVFTATAIIMKVNASRRV